MSSRPHILFVCSRNQWRSPTAEAIYRDDPRIAVRSAGTSDASVRRLTERDLQWADLVLVMEQRHKKRVLRMAKNRTQLPPIESLDIEDDFQRMDETLIELIRAGTEMWLERYFL